MRRYAGIWATALALMVTVMPVTASGMDFEAPDTARPTAPGTNQGRGEEHRSARATAALDAAKDLFRSRGRSAEEPADPSVKYGQAPVDNTCAYPSPEPRKVCVHWVTDHANKNAPRESTEDGNGDGVPD